MSVTTSTRERILLAASELFRRQGFAATGLKSILAASDAPYGSLYHFFPGGKEELGVAVLDAGGNVYRELVEQFFLSGGNVVRATSDFFEGAAVMIAETDYADACPIATIALETASTSEPMRRASAAAFESWLEVLTDRLTEAGIPRRRARELAVELFCAIEGAFLLSRGDAVTRADTDRGQSGDRVSSSGARQGVGEGLDQAHLVGPAHREDHQLDAFARERRRTRSELARIGVGRPHDVDRALDLLVVPSDRLAVRDQDLVESLPLDRVGCARDIPVVGPARHCPERALRTLPADDDREV